MGKIKYTTDKLIDIYEALYQMNLEGADEDYLGLYEQYAPSRCVNGSMEPEEILVQLRSLVNELYEDLGDEDELRSWLSNCGAEEELVDELVG